MLELLPPSLDIESSPLLSTGDDWPEDLVIISLGEGKHGCYCYFGTHGLVAFSSESEAASFIKSEELGWKATLEDMTFDEARDLAKSKPTPVMALILFRTPNNCLVHYVK